MKLYNFLTKHFNETRKLMIDAICEMIEHENVEQIELQKELIYFKNDDDYNQVISSINIINMCAVVTYMGDNVIDVPLNELSFDQLLYILGELENGRYNTPEKDSGLTKEDVIEVASSIGVTLTDDQIDEVLEMYPSEQRNDPTGTWELIIEHCIDMVLD